MLKVRVTKGGLSSDGRCDEEVGECQKSVPRNGGGQCVLKSPCHEGR